MFYVKAFKKAIENQHLPSVESFYRHYVPSHKVSFDYTPMNIVPEKH
ncbi:hypothetical protein [Candidatus Phycorickettsia trachydisci]|nr:hypothetical protein [Candidatus Phycorickettsia trachydisci]